MLSGEFGCNPTCSSNRSKHETLSCADLLRASLLWFLAPSHRWPARRQAMTTGAMSSVFSAKTSLRTTLAVEGLAKRDRERQSAGRRTRDCRVGPGAVRVSAEG